jgi:hypothetical protein
MSKLQILVKTLFVTFGRIGTWSLSPAAFFSVCSPSLSAAAAFFLFLLRICRSEAPA